jgi:translation initiation factor 3 subunit I
MFNGNSLQVKQFRGQGFMTVSKFDYSGNLLFIADKDSKYITQISTHDNMIVGTYNGHNGVIWHLDLTNDSKYMFSCSGDMRCILWEVSTGKIITNTQESGIPKYVSINNNLIAVSCDPISKRSKPYINIYLLDDMLNNKENFKTNTLELEQGIKPTTVNWLNDEILLVSFDNGYLKKINWKTKEIVQECLIHEDSIKSVNISKDKTELITGSLDKTSKIVNIDTFQVKCTFKSIVPVNYACFSSDPNYIMLGGGIEAMMVAKTSDNDLTTKIFQISNQKLVKKLVNHFGPLRYLDVNPNKEIFTTASQDGTVKIYSISKNKLAKSNEISEKMDQLTDIESNSNKYVKFGLALGKSDGELVLNNETIKIEDVDNLSENFQENQKKKSSESFINKNAKLSNLKNQVYPIGHPLYKPKPQLFKINTSSELTPVQSSTIKVSNLPEDVTLGILVEIFEFYGRIEPHGININRYSSEVVAYINYVCVESALKAVEKCNKIKMDHCIITVELQKKK